MYRKGKSLRGASFKKSKRRSQRLFGPKRYTPREKIQNRIWEFTLGDADDHPSVPHAHAKETGERLNAWTGDIYPPGNERVRTIGKLKDKELRRLHSDPNFLKFARKQIEWYQENSPNKVELPEWFELKCRQPQLCIKQNQNEITGFVFIGKAKFK